MKYNIQFQKYKKKFIATILSDDNCYNGDIKNPKKNFLSIKETLNSITINKKYQTGWIYKLIPYEY